MVRKLVFILFLLAGNAMAETAAFDPKTNVLTIPSLRVGAQLFSTTQVALPANGQWAVVGVGEASAAPPSTLTVTPTSISGKALDNIRLNITDGTPPYVVSSSDYSIVSVGSANSSSKTYFSTSPAGAAPQAVATVIIGDKGTAQIWVTDAAGDVLTVSVTSTGAPAVIQNACIQAGTVDTLTLVTLSPATISASTYEPLSLAIGGGKPPYLVTSSRNTIANVGPVSQIGICQASVTISTLAAGTAVITAMDTHGQQATATITITDVQITPFGISPSTIAVRAGATSKISIVGGRPPYQISSSNDFTAYPDKATHNTTTPYAEATIRTRSPGTATITVSEAGGGQASTLITVTP